MISASSSFTSHACPSTANDAFPPALGHASSLVRFVASVAVVASTPSPTAVLQGREKERRGRTQQSVETPPRPAGTWTRLTPFKISF